MRVRSQKKKIGTALAVTVVSILFFTTGCSATYEFTIPDKHPAKADLYELPYEPSQTLVKTDGRHGLSSGLMKRTSTNIIMMKTIIMNIATMMKDW